MTGQRVLFRYHHIGRQFNQPLKVYVARDVQIIGNGEVNFSSAQHCQQIQLVRFPQIDRRLGIFCLKTAPNRGTDQRGDGDQRTHCNWPSSCFGNIICHVMQAAGACQDLFGLIEDALAARGERQPMRMLTNEQLDPQFRLKL